MMTTNLINRFIDGDRRAFEDIYVRYKKQFVSLFYKNQGLSIPDSEDLYQRACVVLYNNIETGRLRRDSLKNNQLKAYLNRTGTFLLYNARRKLQTPLVLDTDFVMTYGSTDNAQDDQEMDDKLFIVRTAVRDMPELCSQLLQLVVYQKKSHKEVAKIMHYANEDSVKTQRHRCMGKLKKIVKERFKIAGYEE